MPDIPRMLAAAHEVKHLFDSSLLACKVNDRGEARVSATICLTIAEQFAATLCLVEAGFSSLAPILVRSMLEGLADLLNLVKDARYLGQMRFENARNDVNLFTEYTHDPEMQEDKEAIANLREWSAKAAPLRAELAAEGFRPQSVVDKFKKAGILQNYVAYRVFCSFAHNQLTTLIGRHGGNFELRYHNEAPPELTASTLNVAVSILCRAVETLPRFTSVSAGEMDQAVKAANEIWSKLN